MLMIGQMARLFGVSTKTLRHYETVGVFRPARHDGATRYRYYAPAQIETLRRIVWLRSIGVSLDAIRLLVEQKALDNEQDLRSAMASHVAALEAELVTKQRLLIELRTFVNQSPERTPSMRAPRIVERPTFVVVGMQYVSSDDTTAIPDLWSKFMPRRGEIQGRVAPDVAYGVCIPSEEGEFRYVAGVEAHRGASVPIGMVSVEVAAQRYAVFTHVGPVDHIADSYRKAKLHGLVECGLVADDGIDLELYDHRLHDGSSSEIDLYLPIKAQSQ